MTKFTVMLAALALIVLAGCRESAQATPTPTQHDYVLAIHIDPEAPTLDDDTLLLITLTDANGDPVPSATISVRGDMNHAGMMPVDAEGVTDEQGVAVIPFVWSMGGDWFVIATATLPDGTTITQRVDLLVRSS